MLDKKETPLGLALFLYFIAFVLIAVIAYNMYFSLVFINYGLTGVVVKPEAGKSVFDMMLYGYESWFIPFFGNTKAVYVLSVALPILAIDLAAASICLNEHFNLKQLKEETDE